MKPSQQELFEANTSWFHVFRSMIDSGDVKKLGPYGVTVYLVIKAHTNFSTGRAFPAIETISDKSGISIAQVKRELKKLEHAGYITIEKKSGRSANVYTLREKIEIKDQTGRPVSVATWDYLPSSVSEAVADLKNVLVTGSDARIVHIEKLTINVAQAGGIIINSIEELPKDIREKLAVFLKSKVIHSSD